MVQILIDCQWSYVAPLNCSAEALYMQRTILITGSASGLGRATAQWLRDAGNRVIGVDLHEADVVADLADNADRARLGQAVRALACEGLDAVIACAGSAAASPERIISVNFFGTVTTLEEFLPDLRRSAHPRAVLVASTASLLETDHAIVEACLAHDEPLARALAQRNGAAAYSASKRAIALWMRRAAIAPRWAGCGIPLNGVSPGTHRTPMTEPFLSTEEGRAILSKATPIATKYYGEPSDAAEVLAFLATMQSTYLVGQMLHVDGGTDALLRPDTF
jgi:NAD(P)-dependent dehydrogenase (short-subunit alcohol dehydrogenase family)